MLLILSGISCSAISTQKSPEIHKQIEEIKAEVEKVEKDIPEGLLKKCRWGIGPEEPTMAELARVAEENTRRYRECYKRHNALVEVLEERQ